MSKQPWYKRILGRKRASAPDGEPDCTQVRESASDYLGGDIPASSGERVKRHLGMCNDCHGWVETLAATVGLLKAIPQERPPETLLQRISGITKE